MERIVIKNFGPIKDVDLEINDFMIFIGPQASGKSTIAKLIYFYKNLNSEIREFLLSKIVELDLRNEWEKLEKKYAVQCIENYFRNIFPEIEIYSNFTLGFYFEDNCVLLIKLDDNGVLNVILPDRFINEFEETLQTGRRMLDKTVREEVKNIIPFILLEINHFISEFMNDINNYRENLYIPAGRGYISTISNQIFDLKTENLDYFIKRFASQIKSIQNNFFSEISSGNITIGQRQSNEFYELLQGLQLKILKGKYLYLSQNERIGLEIESGNFIPLDKASSGQQEAIWIIQYIISKTYQFYKGRTFTVIEEPEAHLYPEAQKSITELITLLANSRGHQVVITTHSPYILASINNLLYANKVGKFREKEVSEKIDKNLWLDYKRVGAYFVGGEGNEGKIRRIMDDELEMIESQAIDSASSIINEEFDYIFALED